MQAPLLAEANRMVAKLKAVAALIPVHTLALAAMPPFGKDPTGTKIKSSGWDRLQAAIPPLRSAITAARTAAVEGSVVKPDTKLVTQMERCIVAHGNALARLREQKNALDRALEAHRNGSPRMGLLRAGASPTPGREGICTTEESGRTSQRPSLRRRMTLTEMSEELSFAATSEQRLRDAIPSLEAAERAARAAYVEQGSLIE